MTELTARDDFEALQQEMASCMNELALTERACVLGTAAIFAWVAANSESLVGLVALVWFVPAAVALFGALKALAVRSHLSLLAQDLAELQGPGATNAAARAPRSFSRRWRARRLASAAAWLLYLGLTIAGSSLGFLQFRTECPGPLVNACVPDNGADDDDAQQEQEHERMKHGT